MSHHMARPDRQSGHNYGKINGRDTTVHAGDYYNSPQIFWMDNGFPDLETLKRQLTQSKERMRELQGQISTLETIIAALENGVDHRRNQQNDTGLASRSPHQPQISHEQDDRIQIHPEELHLGPSVENVKSDDNSASPRRSVGDEQSTNLRELAEYIPPAFSNTSSYKSYPVLPSLPLNSYEKVTGITPKLEDMDVFFKCLGLWVGRTHRYKYKIRFSPPHLMKFVEYSSHDIAQYTVHPDTNGEFVVIVPPSGYVNFVFTLKLGIFFFESGKRYHAWSYQTATEELVHIENYSHGVRLLKLTTATYRERQED